MGPIGVPELIILLVIVVIIFGVGRIPEIGSPFGKSLREFKTETGIGSGHDEKLHSGETVESEAELAEPSGLPHRERIGVRSDDV